MVFVQEIRDEEDLDTQLAGMNAADDDDFTTDDEEYEPTEAKSKCRFNFFALLPLSVRKRCRAWSVKAWSLGGDVMRVLGKTAWIITTSALLIGLPLLYAYDREKSMLEYEKEQQRFAPPVASDSKK